MIRTIDELLDKIAEDLNWRRKELTALKALIQSNEQLRSRVLIRCAVSLLYAHWEGFIKTSSSHYLEYVASLRINYNKLAPNFIALCIRAKFNELGSNNRITAGNSLADFFCNNLSNRSNIPYKKGVDTRHNLSSTVLLEIISILGLNGDALATRHHFIDSKLVDPRNHVAHGEDLGITESDYLSLHDDVLSLIDAFKTAIENAAITRSYIR